MNWTYDDKRFEVIKGRLVEMTGSIFEHQNVLTISSEKKDKIIKKKLYEKFGVKEYWIVQPKKKISVKVLEGFEIDLKEVFE